MSNIVSFDEFKKKNGTNLPTNKGSSQVVSFTDFNIRNTAQGNLKNSPQAKFYNFLTQPKQVDTAQDRRNTWLNTGAKGNILQKAAGTVADVGLNVVKGVASAGEKLGDLASYGVAGVADIVGAKDYAKNVREAAQINLVGNTLQPVTNQVNKYSLTGDKLDSIVQSVGESYAMSQVGGALGKTKAAEKLGLADKLNKEIHFGKLNINIPLMSVLTGASSGITEAYQKGGNNQQAFIKGLTSGLAEGISEGLFGVFGQGGSSFEQEVMYKATKKIENQLARRLTKLGITAAGEGAEEGISYAFNHIADNLQDIVNEAFGKEINKMGSKWDWNEFGENILSGAIAGGLSGGAELLGGGRGAAILESTQHQVENTLNRALTDAELVTLAQETEKQLNNGKINVDEIVNRLQNPTVEDLVQQQGIKSDTTPQLDSGLMQLPTQNFTVDTSGYSGTQLQTYQNAINSGLLNNNKNTHDFVDFVSRISKDKGIVFNFTNNQALQDRNINAQINGYIDNNGITLNVDSNMALEKVIGHEITHTLEDMVNEYNSLKNSFKQLLGEEEFNTRLEQIKDLYKGIEGANYENELISDLAGEYLFTNEDFINRLSTQKPSLFRRIYEEIKYLWKMATGTEQEKQLARTMRIYEQAYRNAGKVSNYKVDNFAQKTQNAQETQTTPQETKPEIKKYPNLTEEEAKEYEFLDSLPFDLTGEDLQTYERLQRKMEGKPNLPTRKDIQFKDIARDYGKYKDLEGYNAELTKDAESLVPDRQGRRTKEQWLDVASFIGERFKGTDEQLKKYAIQSWLAERPNNKDRLNRQGKGYVKFTIEEWMNKIYESANRTKPITQYSLSQDNQEDKITLADGRTYNNYYDFAKDITKNNNDFAKELLFKYYTHNFDIPTNSNETSFYHGTDSLYNYDNFKVMDFDEQTMDRNYGDYFYITPDKGFAHTYGNQIAQFIIPNDKILSLEEYRNSTKNEEELFKDYWAIEMPDNEYIVKNTQPIIDYSKQKAQEYINNKETKYSLSQDNQGRKLTKEQQEFFKDSKVRDENGNLEIVYHQTKNDFTEFKNGFSMRGFKNANFFTNQKPKQILKNMLEGYVKIDNPLYLEDTSIQQNIVDDAIANGYDGIINQNVQGIEGRNEIVTFNSSQFKNATNKKPTSNPDIRYSLSTAEEMEKYNEDRKNVFKQLDKDFGGGVAIWEANLDGRDYDDSVRYLKQRDSIKRKFAEENNIKVEDVMKPVEYRVAGNRNEEIQNYIRENNITMEKLINDPETQKQYFNQLENAMLQDENWTQEEIDDYLTKFNDYFETQRQRGNNEDIIWPLLRFQSDIENIINNKTEVVDGIETAKRERELIDNNPKFDKYVKKYVDKLFKTKPVLDVDEVMEEAKYNHGTTDNYEVGAYMTTDGSLLNFNSNGYRDDHRTIDAFDLNLQEFMDYGAIRMQPEGNGFEISVEPTNAQYNRLEDYIDNYLKEHGDTIYVDCGKEGQSYSSNTPTTKIINDIKAFFRDGQFPKQSEYAQFRYSLSKELDDYVTNNNYSFKDNGNLEVKNLTDKQIKDLVKIYHTTGYEDVSADYLRNMLKSDRAILQREVADRFIEKELGHKPVIDKSQVFEDSEGRKLTQEQVDFYKNSDVRDIRGRLIPVYHRTDSDFTVFDQKAGTKHGKKYGPGFYFSITPENYGNRTLEVYLNAQEGEYKYIPKMGYYIVQNPNQIKNVDNLNPTESDDIRYQLSETTENLPIGQFRGKNVRRDINVPTTQENALNVPLNRQKRVLNPTEISNLNPEDANTTPILPTTRTLTGDRQSKFLNNLNQTEMLSQESKDLINNADIGQYRSVTNEESLRDASQKLSKGGKAETERWFRNDPKNVNATDIAEGFILLNQYQEIARNSNNAADKYQANQSMVEVAKKLRQIGTEAGQTLQAYSILSRMTPEGMVYYAQSELQDAYNEMVKNKSRQWIEQNRENFELKPEETQFILDTMNEVANMEDGYEKKVKLAEIQKLMTDKLPPAKGQKMKSWMRISMLFNPKTQVRNVAGNALIAPVNSFSDIFASYADKLVSRKTGRRTTGVTNIKAMLDGFKKGAYQATTDYRKGINTRDIEGNRFEIGEGKSFNDKTMIGKALNNTEGLLNYVMDAGDRVFSEAAFENSLRNQLKLNNTNEITQDMIDIARQESLSRTWNDNNNYTQFVLNVRSMLNKVNFGTYGLGDVLIPFAKTPANLTKAIVDYSPVGFVNTLLKGQKLSRSLENGQYTPQLQHDFVQTLGKATAGTMLYVLGMALAKAGITSGESDDDKDTQNFLKNTLGISNYSIKIGNKSFTYDWAQPIAAPLSITANIANRKDKEQALGEAILSNLDTASSVLLEQSFMQGINEVLNGNGGIVDGLINQVLGLPARAIPTLSKQIVDLTDSTQRTSFEYGKPVESAINAAKAKIPGLSKTLAPVVDTMGREVQRYGGKNNLFNVFLNPANVNTENISEAASEIYRVYKETGDKTIMPRVAPYYINQNGEKITLNSKQKAEYQTISGNIIEENMNDLINNQAYQNLNDTEKASMINDLVNYAYNKARKDVLNIDMSNTYNKINEFIKDGGTPAEYYTNKEEIDYAYANPNKYSTIRQITTYNMYQTYDNSIKDIKTKYSTTDERKNAIINYVNSLELGIPQKAMLIRMNYSSFKQYDNLIIDYINSQDLTVEQKSDILKEIGFTIKNGVVYN